jgi:hypothetical protein
MYDGKHRRHAYQMFYMAKKMSAKHLLAFFILY